MALRLGAVPIGSFCGLTVRMKGTETINETGAKSFFAS